MRAISLLVLVLAVGCDIPVRTTGTLQSVTGNVAVTHHTPGHTDLQMIPIPAKDGPTFIWVPIWVPDFYRVTFTSKVGDFEVSGGSEHDRDLYRKVRKGDLVEIKFFYAFNTWNDGSKTPAGREFVSATVIPPTAEREP